MKREFRDKWCELLRSGTIEQGKGLLCADGKRCCLGVAYLVDDAGATIFDEYGTLFFDNHSGMPAEHHQEVWGLSDEEVCVLANMNDDGNSFKEIADYIEEFIPVED